MTTITLTSELDAINTMLSCIGEAPVNSIEVSGLADVDMAKAVLNEISRSVQASGWHFNQETDFPLPRNVSGEITVPSNTLNVDTTKRFDDYDVVQRGTRLYNKTTRSFVFDKDIEVDLTLLIEWAELPEAARQYIMTRAARVFQARQLGSDTQHRFSEADEAVALANFKDAEGSTGDYNMLNSSWSVGQVLDR